MKPKVILQLLEVLIVPVGIFAVLAMFSISVGWNLFTMLLFWFVFVPLLAYYLPALISKKATNPASSVIGLILLYAFMVLMIYDHFQTDYFVLMMISLIFNLGIVLMITWIRKERKLDVSESIPEAT